MDPNKRADLILEAALEWGAEATYDVQPGTLGMTLYIDTSCQEEARLIRQKCPIFFHGLYVVVTYPTHILTYEDIEEEIEDEWLSPELYDPE